MANEKFIIGAEDQPGRIEIFNLSPADPDMPIESFSVRVIDEGLNATARALVAQAPSLVAYFAELAENWRGWQGARKWSAPGGEFKLEAVSDGLGHVFFSASIAPGPNTSDWRIAILIHSEAGLLDKLRADAETFFGPRKFAEE